MNSLRFINAAKTHPERVPGFCRHSAPATHSKYWAFLEIRRSGRSWHLKTLLFRLLQQFSSTRWIDAAVITPQWMMLKIAVPRMQRGEWSWWQVTVFECHWKFTFIILIVSVKISPFRPDYARREIRTPIAINQTWQRCFPDTGGSAWAVIKPRD